MAAEFLSTSVSHAKLTQDFSAGAAALAGEVNWYPRAPLFADVLKMAEQRHCNHWLFIAIAMRLRDAAVIARFAQLIRDETAAFQAARRRPAICLSQSRLLYRDMGAGAKRSHRSNQNKTQHFQLLFHSQCVDPSTQAAPYAGRLQGRGPNPYRAP